MKKTKLLSEWLLLIALLAAFFLPVFRANAAVASIVPISPYLPGSAASPSSSPGAYLYDFYYLALIVGGILAFGAIVFGGIKYATSGGNPSAASEARQWIQSALVGLLLLAAAYLILATISPGLTSLNFASLGTVSTGGGANICNNPCFSNCCSSGQTCNLTTQACIAAPQQSGGGTGGVGGTSCPTSQMCGSLCCSASQSCVINLNTTPATHQCQ